MVGKFIKAVVLPYNFPKVTRWGSALVKFKSTLLSNHNIPSANDISIYCKNESLDFVASLSIALISNCIYLFWLIDCYNFIQLH